MFTGFAHIFKMKTNFNALQPLVLTTAIVANFVLFQSASAQAAIINWTDWTTSNNSLNSNFIAQGTITTATSSVDVTYSNPQGIAFYQPSGGTDYWQNNRTGRTPATSPYTSTTVSNIPTGTDLIALQSAGNQTLTFSQTIANPVFSYVSLNGNGYAFDQDFNILSVGDPATGKDCGYWSCGTSSKSIVFNPSNGTTEYQLIGTGEPHGTLQFTGVFDTVSWRSLSYENWNGFTVGIQGTAAEVFPATAVPEPFTIIGTLIGGTAAIRMRKKLNAISD
jgi:hypothetical protein